MGGIIRGEMQAVGKASAEAEESNELMLEIPGGFIGYLAGHISFHYARPKLRGRDREYFAIVADLRHVPFSQSSSIGRR